ncbi:MAG TPA: exodeoxyribonuclease VII small subunit [Candidatus Saccharimonadales bacterium]|nr:exodeoxyribonuclease VII small subunit [Candidatus Saccharimonadales bacterium]
MTKPSDNFDFGAGLTELEAITTWFESEQVDLDEGLKKFERGMELAEKLRTHLDQVENRVEKIKAKYDAPQPDEEPTNSADSKLF